MTRKIILGGYWEWDDDQYPDPYQSYGEASADDDDDADADADADDVEPATLEEWLQWNYADIPESHPEFEEYLNEALEHYLYDGIVPALCQENCSVELDGHCQHGYPSPFVELGLI